jgi:general L-amino acid transport system substrate-binding protein
MDSRRRNLTDLFAWPAGFMALLCAIQAFAAIAFQTFRDSVISLDLTGIIAFDAFREWEAAHRQPMRVREWALKWELHSQTKKDQASPGSRGRL